MVRVGFVRSGDINHININRKNKVVFYREFNNISEMAEWFVKCWPRVCVADYGKLTKKEKISFWSKLGSLRRKKDA